MKKIYILDDELPVLEPLALWFERHDYAVKTFLNTFDFLNSLLSEKPSVVVMDISLAGDDGRQLCMLVKAKYAKRLPVILMSATPTLGENYKEYDADAFVAKPFSLHAMQKVIDGYIN